MLTGVKRLLQAPACPCQVNFTGDDIDEKMRTGTAAGNYAGRLLKASYAAQPKGCSACFVPPTHK